MLLGQLIVEMLWLLVMQTDSCPIRTKGLVRMILLVKASLTIMVLRSTSEWEGRGGQDRESSKSSKAVNPPCRAGPHHLRPHMHPYSCPEDYANEERAFCQKPWPNPTIFKAHETGPSGALFTFWWCHSWTKQFYKESLCRRTLSHFVYPPSENVIIKCFIIGMHSVS